MPNAQTSEALAEADEILATRKARYADGDLNEARLRMAELLIEQSKLPEAEEHFAILYKQKPDNLNVRIGYARCLMNQGYSENALKLLETLDEKSTDSPLLFLKCQAAFEANENTKAEKWLEVLQLDPTYDEARDWQNWLLRAVAGRAWCPWAAGS